MESPANLKPKKIINNRLTIFLNFKDSLNEESLQDIYIFKDTESSNLPLIENPKLHTEKVNLDLINEFRFRSISDVIN